MTFTFHDAAAVHTLPMELIYLDTLFELISSNKTKSTIHLINLIWINPMTKMASFRLSLPIGITSLVLLCVFIISIPTTHSKNFGTSTTDATISECEPSLMILLPCESFVQGMAPLPSLTCCNNMKELLEEDEDLRCLCLLLSDPTLVTVPINRTLALQLPALCDLQANISTCSGLTRPIPRSPRSPTSQVTFQSRTNSTVSASPAVTVVPKSRMMGFNSRSIGEKLGAEGHIAMALLTAIVFAWRI